jgi:FkbM family methyltransferase
MIEDEYDYKWIKGFWIPKEDKHCHPAVLGNIKDIDHALKYCRYKRLCIQAGGNFGAWPAYLATEFEKVVTYEPDEVNFGALVRNTCHFRNLIPFQYGLGAEVAMVGIERDPKNVGAHQLTTTPGHIPVTTIDRGPPLANIDLIMLDIEGMEPLALEGAKQTIKRCRPVIMVEDKGLSQRYGFEKGWSREFPGYRVEETVHRDVILTPIDA